MLEIIIIVLLFCNKDGSKTNVIYGLCVAGMILSTILCFVWTGFAALDLFLYIIFALIAGVQKKG